MAVNPYPIIPRDKGGEPLQGMPAPKLAIQRITSENATTSSVITLSPDTTLIEIAAIRGPMALKWIASGDTTASIITLAGATSNYDHALPQDTVQRFAVPIETIYQAPSSMVGAGVQNGLYRRVAYRSMNIGSVMLSEF